MDFDGKVLLSESKNVDVAGLSSKVYLDWPLKKLADAGAADTSRVLVVADLQTGGASDFAMNGTQISRNLVYLAPTKEVHLQPAALKLETLGASGNYKIRVTSPILARDVYLAFGDLDVKLSDNYFDILPGETVEITAASNVSLDVLKAKLKVISLADAFNGATQGATIGAAQ
jgi:beta-mannosidase